MAAFLEDSLEDLMLLSVALLAEFLLLSVALSVNLLVELFLDLSVAPTPLAELPRLKLHLGPVPIASSNRIDIHHSVLIIQEACIRPECSTAGIWVACERLFSETGRGVGQICQLHIMSANARLRS